MTASDGERSPTFSRLIPSRLRPPGRSSQTVSVAVGLLVLGMTAYGFLLLSARVLGPSRYASLSALWAMVFLVGPGFFLPLEQEVGRSLAARRARGMGDGALLRRAAVLGGAATAVLVLAVAAFRSPLLDQLFDGQGLLLVGFVLSLVGYFAEHLVRGSLAGHGHFPRYGLVLGTEGALRLVGCVALAVFGVASAGPYGVVLGGAPLLAALAGTRRRVGRASPPGPPAPYRDLTSSLGWLLAASVSAQLLVNAAPLAVKVLATSRQQAEAGRFLAGLVIARVPLFLFVAVQASLLPRLSELHASGRQRELRSTLRRLMVGVAALAFVATVGAAIIGPRVLEVLFGSGYRLGGRDLALLTAASGAYMLALTAAQPLIALSSPARVALGWVVGLVAFVVTTVAMSDLLARVEWAFLAGSLVAAASMSALLVPLLGDDRPPGRNDLAGLAQQVPVEP